jgi:AbrB family looped-hinge helix DNA binding protein
MQTTIKVDSKGRVSIPKKVREQAGFGPGDTLFLAIDQPTGTVQLRKVSNPFDGLALQAIAEYEAARTTSLREIAEEAGIELDDERQT